MNPSMNRQRQSGASGAAFPSRMPSPDEPVTTGQRLMQIISQREQSQQQREQQQRDETERQKRDADWTQHIINTARQQRSQSALPDRARELYEQEFPSRIPVTRFQGAMLRADQPSEGEVQRGYSPMQTAARTIDVDPDRLLRSPNPGRELTRTIDEATGLSDRDRQVLEQAGIRLFPGHSDESLTDLTRRYASNAKAQRQPMKQEILHSAQMMANAYRDGGIEGAQAMAREIQGSDQKVRESRHEITPDEAADVRAARREVAFNRGVAEGVTNEARFARNALTLATGGNDEFADRVINKVPGVRDAENALSSDPELLRSVEQKGGVTESLLRALPAGAMAGTRYGAAASALPAAAIPATAAMTGIENADLPAADQMQAQLINLLGAGAGAGAAKAAARVGVSPVVSGALTGGAVTAGSAAVLNPEMSSSDLIAQTMIGAGTGAAMGAAQRPSKQPAQQPSAQAPVQTPTASGAMFPNDSPLMRSQRGAVRFSPPERPQQKVPVPREFDPVQWESEARRAMRDTRLSPEQQQTAARMIDNGLTAFNAGDGVELVRAQTGLRDALTASKRPSPIDLLNAPRALMASADLSAPFRQGAILTMSEPRLWKAEFGNMLRSLSSGKHQRVMAEMQGHPRWQEAKSNGLYLSMHDKLDVTPSLTGREETFVSRLVDRLPIVKGSERAYGSFLDTQRLHAYDLYATELQRAGVSDPKAFQDVAKWINYATGRGDLGKTGNQVAPVLNSVFFAPRFVASRFQVLNPVMYAQMQPAARKIALRQMLGFAAVAGTTMGLMKAAGADVETGNPNNPDWLKIREGNTRYDLLAGEQQSLRFVFRFTKALTESARGQKMKYGQSPAEIASRFLRSKLSPPASYAADAMTGKDFSGEPFNAGRGALERMVPLFVQDLTEAARDEGWAGAAKTLPAFVGVGVSSYEERQRKPRAPRKPRTPQAQPSPLLLPSPSPSPFTRK